MTSHPYFFSRRRYQRTLPAGAISVFLALLSSGCVVIPNEEGKPEHGEQENIPKTPTSPPERQPEERNSIASTITSSTDLGADLQIDIIALERLQNDILRLRIEITNKSDNRFLLYDGLGESGDYQTASAVTLIDAENQQRYLSYDQSDGSCFCQKLEGALAGDSTAGLWIAFPSPPDDLESMTVTTPLTPPIFDVPISETSDSLENQELAAPVILDLTMISDDLEDQTGRTESNDEVSIILSSDVLFDTNSAELNTESQEILEQVAIEISDATSTVVSVDGHADSTGDESMNQSLSLERAQAVKSSLSELVTRNGVEFDVAGYGSSQPIADNSTEEGRKRNRRVSITFEK